MTHKEIVAFCKNNITDWIIGNTNYEFGNFNAQSKQIPVEVYICTSVNNAQWDWLINSYTTWELVSTIINWIKQAKSDKIEKKR